MILDTIVARKKEEVAALKQKGIHLPPEFAETAIEPPRGFRQALLDYVGVSIIAEAKKASPSKGVIQPDFDPVIIARAYEQGGAQAMSVLTDVDFFQGSLLYMMQARATVSIPVLRKDFIIHELQIQEASTHGADAILLMASILDAFQLRDFQAVAAELNMDALVEVHSRQELDTVLDVGCRLLGVNNRNLKDFSMDIETTFRLKQLVPDDIPVVSESGLKNNDDIRRLADAGITAALIGETLMRGNKGGDTIEGLRSS